MTGLVDSFNLRIANIGNIQLLIRVENTLPLFMCVEERVNEYKFRDKTIKVTQGTTNKLVDSGFTGDRFILISGIQSPVTNNVAYMYYDKKYKDILIIPNVEFLQLGLSGMSYEVRASRLGSGCDLPSKWWHQDVPNAEQHSYQLPEVKSGLSLKTLLVSFPGTATTTNNNRNDGFEEMINNVYNIRHNMRRITTLIEIGVASNLFNNPTSLPLYMLYQHSLMEYGLHYVSNINPGQNKLYFRLKF